MNLFTCLAVSKNRSASLDPGFLLFRFSSNNSRSLPRIWWRVKHIDSVLYCAIIKNSMQILEYFPGLKIGHNLSDAKYELGGIWWNFILFLNLIESDSVFELFPVGFGQLEEVIEYEIEYLGHTPSISEEFVLENFNFICKDHKGGSMIRLHIKNKL